MISVKMEHRLLDLRAFLLEELYHIYAYSKRHTIISYVLVYIYNTDNATFHTDVPRHTIVHSFETRVKLFGSYLISTRDQVLQKVLCLVSRSVEESHH